MVLKANHACAWNVLVGAQGTCYGWKMIKLSEGHGLVFERLERFRILWLGF